VLRRTPCSGFARELQRTEAETKRGSMASTFQTRRILVEEFGMMTVGYFECGDVIQEEAGQAGRVVQCLCRRFDPATILRAQRWGKTWNRRIRDY